MTPLAWMIGLILPACAPTSATRRGQRDRGGWVACVFNFPDPVGAHALEGPNGNGSLLILSSAAVYGEADFRVNRGRVKTWLAALDRALGTPNAANR